MPESGSHYEVVGETAQGWTVLDVFDDKDSAVDAANGHNDGKYPTIRVNLVTLDESTGTKSDQEILFLSDQSKPGKKPSTEEKGEPVCVTVDDFSRISSRRLIKQLLGDWLAQTGITPLELLHHPDYLSRLEGAGTLLQGAVQRTAIAQARYCGTPVQARTRELFALADEVALRLRKDARAGQLPLVDRAGISALVAAAEQQDDARYLVYCGVTNWLRPCRSLGEKLGKLLEILGDANEASIEILDPYLADFLDDRAALSFAFGEQPDLGAVVLRIAELLKGEFKATNEFDHGLAQLSKLIGQGVLPASHAALVRRLAKTLTGRKALRGNDLVSQIAFNLEVQTALTDEEGNVIGETAVSRALASRCERYLYPETIGEMLEGIKEPSARLNKLLDIEPGIIGAANKRKLGDYIVPIVLSPSNGDQLIGNEAGPQAAMVTIATLQRRIAGSQLDAEQKERASNKLDEYCVAVLKDNRIFERVLKSNGEMADKVMTILKLCANGTFTEGRALGAARQLVLKSMKDPKFIECFARESLEQEDKLKRFSTFQTLLQQAGVNSEGLGV